MTQRRSVLTHIGATLTAAALSRRTQARTRVESRPKETIAMLGTGRMASVLGKGWAGGGHTVIYGSRTPADARVASLVQQTGRRASATTPRDAVAQADMI